MKDWIEDKIGNLAKINEETINRYSNFETIEYIDTSSVTEGVFEAPQILKFKEAPSRAKRIVKERDIIVSTVRPVLKHFGLIKNPKENTIVSTGFAVISAKSIEPAFLYYFLASEFVTNYLSLIAENQTSAYPSFNPELIRDLKINFPKLPATQQRIASILSAYDDLIEVNSQRIKLLEQTASQLYKEWFVRMRFPNCKKTKFVKGVPEGWEVKKLKKNCLFKYGTMPKSNLIKESGYPIFSGYGIVGFYEKVMFKDKTLIVVARGVGGTGDIKLTPRNCWLTNLAIAIFPDDINMLKYFLYYTLSAIDLRYLDSGSAQSQITIADLGNLKLLVPNIDLQKKFEKIVIPIDNQIENLQQQNTQLRQIRDRLLPRLVSGKLQVKEISKNKKANG